jgi:hypothetical protein
MPAILQDAAARQHNVIVRPRSSDATLIQLDDLGEDAAARLLPAVRPRTPDPDFPCFCKKNRVEFLTS